MWRNPSFVIKKQVKFQEGEQCLLLPTTSPPTILKPRTVCCQEGEDDDDMTPLDMTIDYLVSSFRHLHSKFWYNSLGSICTCLYLIEGTIVFKVQTYQSPTFGSAAQQCFFTLGTPAQVGACLKVDNTFGMVQDVLHLGHHLRRPARALQSRWRPKPIRLRFSFGL